MWNAENFYLVFNVRMFLVLYVMTVMSILLYVYCASLLFCGTEKAFSETLVCAFCVNFPSRSCVWHGFTIKLKSQQVFMLSPPQENKVYVLLRQMSAPNILLLYSHRLFIKC